jgi:hypothetical protein
MRAGQFSIFGAIEEKEAPDYDGYSPIKKWTGMLLQRS